MKKTNFVKKICTVILLSLFTLTSCFMSHAGGYNIITGKPPSDKMYKVSAGGS